MESSDKTSDFFGLITELSKSLLDKSALDKNNPKYHWIINRMRKKSFEILLKKRYDINGKKFISYFFLDKNLIFVYFLDNQEINENLDPTTDLLKYAFVLRSSLGLGSRATKLENAMDQLLDESNLPNATLTSVLKFLCALKTYETPEKDDLVRKASSKYIDKQSLFLNLFLFKFFFRIYFSLVKEIQCFQSLQLEQTMQLVIKPIPQVSSPCQKKLRKI